MCTQEEREVLNRGSKKSDRLRQQLMRQGGGGQEPDEKSNSASGDARSRILQGLNHAIEHKDRLLDYDRTAYVTMVTTVRLI